MPAVSLPTTKHPMLRMTPRVIFPYRVHCSSAGCGWSCPARDEEDACEVLGQHLTTVHAHPPQES
jgi:hypothetical protein